MLLTEPFSALAVAGPSWMILSQKCLFDQDLANSGSTPIILHHNYQQTSLLIKFSLPPADKSSPLIPAGKNNSGHKQRDVSPIGIAAIRCDSDRTGPNKGQLHSII